MGRSNIDFARDEEGMKACEEFYKEYHARVEEWYSKEKMTATDDEEVPFNVDDYNYEVRLIIEEKVMDDMIEERWSKRPDSFLKRLKQKFLILLKNLM